MHSRVTSPGQQPDVGTAIFSILPYLRKRDS